MESTQAHCWKCKPSLVLGDWAGLCSARPRTDRSVATGSRTHQTGHYREVEDEPEGRGLSLRPTSLCPSVLRPADDHRPTPGPVYPANTSWRYRSISERGGRLLKRYDRLPPKNRADRIGDVVAERFTPGRVCGSNRDFVAFHQEGHPVATPHIGWADLHSDLPHSVKWDLLRRVFKEAPPAKRDGC